MFSRIVAFDPGGTTGWAMITYDTENPMAYTFNGGMLDALNHHAALYNNLGIWACRTPEDMYPKEFHDAFTVVSESFEYRNASRPGLVLVSVEYIGILKLFCSQYKIPIYFQTASQGKIRDKSGAFVRPDNLKRLGLYSPARVHEMDAYGHLLYHIINKKDRTDEALNAIRNEIMIKGWKD